MSAGSATLWDVDEQTPQSEVDFAVAETVIEMRRSRQFKNRLPHHRNLLRFPEIWRVSTPLGSSHPTVPTAVPHHHGHPWGCPWTDAWPWVTRDTENACMECLKTSISAKLANTALFEEIVLLACKYHS